MVQEGGRSLFRHGLAFYGTLAFVAGFFGARAFGTLYPEVVVLRAGIHFHHFWYGLAMIILAGWVGITINDERFGRGLAMIFGLGAGFVGDEVGLLLTLGDYQSELSLMFFVGTIGFILLAVLFLRFRRFLETEVLGVDMMENLTYVGLFLAAFSTVFFAFGALSLGFVFAGLGVFLFLLCFKLERRPTSIRATV